MWKISLRIVLIILLQTLTAQAQQPTVAESRLGVDRVRLISGETLHGFLLKIEPNQPLVLAVERKWLASTYPQLSEHVTATEREVSQANKKQLLARTKNWLDEVGQEPSVLNGLLKSQLDRLEKITDPIGTVFVRVELPLAEVAEKTQQPVQRRQIAGLAWQHGLANPTTTPVTTLARQLAELGVDVAKERVDLADQVASGPESERQWAIRRALVEYRFDEAVEYQGTGKTLVRQDKTVDVSSLLTEILGGAGGEGGLLNQLGAELGLIDSRQLAESDDWYTKVTQAVERDGLHAVRITRLNQSLLSPLIRVDTHFFVMEKPGVWFEAVKFSAEADANTVPSERTDLIKSDPQVKQVLDTLTSLGLPIDQARIDQALRHGAAAQEAAKKADKQFQEFLGFTKEKLDAPLPPGL
ncbi:MAG: hypothetical protein ABI557_00365 [Aureliella sp.]